MNPLYTVQVNCVCCLVIYKTSKVRVSFKRSTGQDTDFCTRYRGDLNPNFYVVHVCPNCGYANTENGMSELTDDIRAKYYKQLGAQWVPYDYGGARSIEDARATFKLALICSQLSEASERHLAGLLHHIAWLYRLEGNTEQENRFLKFALDAYIKVYEKNKENINDAKLMYMIGELHLRLSNVHEAVRWFNYVIGDKNLTDPLIIRLCREQWQHARTLQQSM